MSNSPHSFKDYTGRSLADRPASEFSGQTVRGSCFAHERPDAVVFPDGVTDCVLQDCQLDNVVIPSGFTVVRGSTRRILAQPDGTDWIVDEDNQPVSPV